MKRPLMHPRRIALLILVVVAVVVVIQSDTLHRSVLEILAVAERVMREHPRTGMLLFLALAAISATLSFFSSAALVPVGVFVWGKFTTMLLLWVGGTVGGLVGYWFARTLGRRVVKRLFPEEPLRRYETFFATRARWRTILLFRVALQSELPSYVLGLVRYPLPRYLPIIMLAELGFVILEVFLGAAFIERSATTFTLVLVVGVALIAWAWRRLQREMAEGVGS